MNHPIRRMLCGILPFVLALSLFGCARDVRPSEGVGKVKLCAVGDIYLTDDMLSAAKTADGYNFLPQFSDILMPLTSADLTVGNFEGTFAGMPYGAAEGSYPDALAAMLATAGFDLLQTANSYTLFNGVSGMERTRSVIEENGMTALGSYLSESDRAENQVVIREVDGVRVAFVAFTKGLGGISLPNGSDACVNLLYTDYTSNYEDVDTDAIVSVLKAAKKEKPDVIVAMLHWGSEGVTEVSRTQKQIANLMVDNGVDVIIGSHSHEVCEVERRTVAVNKDRNKEVVIAYGLGDFSAVSAGGTTVSLMLELEFTRDHATGITTLSGLNYRTVAGVDNGEGFASRYSVLDGDSAVTLYENNYYARVNESAYDRILAKREKIRKLLGLLPEE